jgi:hypothetical protein
MMRFNALNAESHHGVVADYYGILEGGGASLSSDQEREVDVSNGVEYRRESEEVMRALTD